MPQVRRARRTARFVRAALIHCASASIQEGKDGMAGAAGVAAVDRALAIRDAFTDQDQKLSLAELAKRTGLYKSTAIRLAKSLEKGRYLHRS